MNQNNVEELQQKITELESALRVEARKYEMITKYSNCGLWEYDIWQKKLIQSRKLDGKWSKENLIIENFRESVLGWNMIHPEDIAIFNAYCDSMDAGESNFVYELRAVTEESRTIWMRYEGNTVLDDEGKPGCVIGKTLDITKEKQEKALLEQRASHDTLTNLYNRATTKEMITKRITNVEKETGALILVDIDDFNYINHNFGHLYGDSVLELFSNVLYTNFNANDIVGRIGGDEFMIYCSELNTEKMVYKVLERLYVRVQEFIKLNHNRKLCISMGVAFVPTDGKSFDELFYCADIALSDSKQRGKNTYTIYHKELKDRETLGEITRKQNRAQSENIIEGAANSNIDKELFDFSFEVISRTENLYDAMQTILAEVSLYFNLDRSTLVQFNASLQKVELGSKWVREEDGRDTDVVLTAARECWTKLEEAYQKYDFLKLQYGRSEQYDFSNMLSRMQRPSRSAIQFPIRDGNRLAGLLGFECWADKEWKQVEIDTLSSISKMISSYLLHMQMKDELEREMIYSSKAMDVQKLVYYAVDKNYKITYMSGHTAKLRPQAKYGQLCYQALRGGTEICPECPIAECNQEHSQNSIEIYENSTDSWHTLTASLIEKCADRQEQYLLCKSDVTAFLERVKSVDQLTGTLSYDKFRAETVKKISEQDKPYSMVFLGIQNFARINDEYGYETGDDILRTMGSIICKTLTETELICRVKGDDFVALLENGRKFSVQEKIRLMLTPLEDTIRKSYPGLDLNCFAGIYKVKDTDRSVSIVLDKAMQARKVAQNYYYELGGIYEYSSVYEEQQREEKEMERLMKEALHTKLFRVYFQPKVSIATGKVVGAEALIRLVTREEEVISPGRFIPLAEKNGLIVDIDNYVYESTFSLVKTWLAEGKKVPKISVNMSRIHLYQDDLREHMKQLSEKYELEPNTIELEITESIFFEDTERLVSMVKLLKDVGYSISMDDFGAGFSTLSLMTELPIDTLKVDGSFFMSKPLDAKNRAVVTSILQLAKNLQFETVMEGVETQEQVDFIKEQGGDCVQGFYYYRPMPAREFVKLL